MNEERLKKTRAAIEEGLTQLGYLRIGHAHGPAADELARAVMGFEEAERRLNLAVKADAESQKEAGDTGATDAHSGTLWSLGSAASGSATEDRWLEKHRPGLADGSGYAEGEQGPLPGTRTQGPAE